MSGTPPVEGPVAEAALASTVKPGYFGNLSTKKDTAPFIELDKLNLKNTDAEKIEFNVSGLKILPGINITFKGEEILYDRLNNAITIKGKNVGLEKIGVSGNTILTRGGNRRSKRHHASHKSKKHSHKKTLKRIKKFFQKK